MTTADQIRDLISRLARLDAAETWEVNLNPTQIAALDYLARANRFSRAPSHVAEYLGTTRGTMSQTLKTLVRKGYLEESRSESDRRSITYDLTDSGLALVDRQNTLAQAILSLSPSQRRGLADGLSSTLKARLAVNQGRSFGICKDCVHHEERGKGAFCALLLVPLAPAETGLTCHEHTAD
jgi:DNA-binding MarR family transcriptional regulator